MSIKKTDTGSQITVFYDGQCPLCSREIAHYKKRSGADTINWVDVTSTVNLLENYGIDVTDALAYFHVRSSDGTIYKGAYAFAELWACLPAYAWLAGFIKRFRLLGLLEWFYAYFARWRQKKACSDGRCSS